MGERLKRLDPRKPGVTITVAMATFHTPLLVMIGVALVFLSGDLGAQLDGGGPLAGLGLFAYVWVITWVTAAGALRRLEWPDFKTERVMETAAIWGGFTGVALYGIPAVPLALVIVVSAVVSLDPVEILAGFFFLVIYGLAVIPLIFAGGVVLGMLVGLLDMLLFGASRLGDGELAEWSRPRERAP